MAKKKAAAMPADEPVAKPATKPASYVEKVAKKLDMTIEELEPYRSLLRKGERFYPVDYVVKQIKNERKSG